MSTEGRRQREWARWQRHPFHGLRLRADSAKLMAQDGYGPHWTLLRGWSRIRGKTLDGQRVILSARDYANRYMELG